MAAGEGGPEREGIVLTPLSACHLSLFSQFTQCWPFPSRVAHISFADSLEYHSTNFKAQKKKQ